jgi:hypothetical protein
MNPDFIKVKALDGELIISHKKNDFGMTISSEEFVLQRPHINYYIKLEQILSIVPFERTRTKPISFLSQRSSGLEITNEAVGVPHYKFYVKEVVVHNRSGISTIGPVEFIMPVIYELLQVISKYGGMSMIKTG